MGNTHLITGYAGTEHIMSADQGSFNASFFGTGEYVMEAGNQLEASITNNSTVRILDGDILMQGRHIRIKPNTYEDVTITTGTAGVNRHDLIVCEYYKDANTGVESAEIKVIMGTASNNPSDPDITSGDILAGDSLNQMPLYRVKINGVVLASIEPMFSTLSSYGALAEQYEQEFITACTNHLNSLNVLDTMEEIEANMQANQLAGALALKELNAHLTYLVTDTLAAGQTSITLSDDGITEDSIIEPYQYIGTSATKIIAPLTIAVSEGSCTMTFDAQDNDVLVGIRVL